MPKTLISLTGDVMDFGPLVRLQQQPLAFEIDLSMEYVRTMSAGAGVAVGYGSVEVANRAPNGHPMIQISFPLDVRTAAVLTASAWDADFPDHIATTGPRANDWNGVVPVVALREGDAFQKWNDDVNALLPRRDESVHSAARALLKVTSVIGDLVDVEGHYGAATIIRGDFEVAVAGPSIVKLSGLLIDLVRETSTSSDFRDAVMDARRFGKIFVYSGGWGCVFSTAGMKLVSVVPEGSGLAYTVPIVPA